MIVDLIIDKEFLLFIRFTNGNHHLDDGGLVNDDNGAHQHLTDDAAPTSQVQELDQLEEQKVFSILY